MKLNRRQFVIAGAGGFGKEVRLWLKHYATAKYGQEGSRWFIRGFIDDNPEALAQITGRAPSLGSITDYLPEPDDVIVMGIGLPRVRRAVAETLLKKRVPFETLIHPQANISPTARFGAGVIVGPLSGISEDVRIGDFVLINAYVSSGHDTEIEDFSEVCPRVSISGACHLEQDVFIAANSSVAPGKRLGRGTQVATCTAVMRNTRPYGFVQGVPGKEHRDFFKPKEKPKELVLSDYPLTRSGIPQSTRKEPFNILLTCAGRRVELVEEFQRSLKAIGLQGNVLVSEVSDFSASMTVADETLPADLARGLGYFDQLKELIQKNNIHLLVPMTDWDIHPLARHQKQLQDIGCDVMIGSENNINICRSKLEFSRFLESKNLPFIPTHELESFRANPFYPCFAKLDSSSGSIGAAKIDSPTALKKHLAEFRDPMLIQQFIEGQEFTVDVYKARSGEVKVIVPRQRLRIRSGEVEQGITINDPDIVQATRDLAEAFEGLWGVFCCQFRKTADCKVYPIEINPRFGGGAPLSIAAGADLPLYLLQDILGMEITTDGTFHENLLMMRYPAAKFAHVHNPKSLPGFDAPISL